MDAAAVGSTLVTATAVRIGITSEEDPTEEGRITGRVVIGTATAETTVWIVAIGNEVLAGVVVAIPAAGEDRAMAVKRQT